MSSISGISSNTNQYPPSSQNGFGQVVQDFQAIGTALQSGSLSSAQNALATFQQAVQPNSQASSSQPFGSNTQANSDYQNLVGALQSGNLSTAQQAFSSLQTDLKSTSSTTHGHHHHHHSSGTTSSTASSSTSNNPTSSFLSAITSTGLDVTA